MKRFFVFAFMALVAIGCSSESQKISVAEQADKYTAQMIELMNEIVDQDAIVAAKGSVEDWYQSLDAAKQQEIAQKCQKFTELEKEFATWRTNLDEESKKEFQEYAKSSAKRNDMRNVRVIQRLKMITARHK